MAPSKLKRRRKNPNAQNPKKDARSSGNNFELTSFAAGTENSNIDTNIRVATSSIRRANEPLALSAHGHSTTSFTGIGNSEDKADSHINSDSNTQRQSAQSSSSNAIYLNPNGTKHHDALGKGTDDSSKFSRNPLIPAPPLSKLIGLVHVDSNNYDSHNGSNRITMVDRHKANSTIRNAFTDALDSYIQFQYLEKENRNNVNDTKMNRIISTEEQNTVTPITTVHHDIFGNLTLVHRKEHREQNGTERYKQRRRLEPEEEIQGRMTLHTDIKHEDGALLLHQGDTDRNRNRNVLSFPSTNTYKMDHGKCQSLDGDYASKSSTKTWGCGVNISFDLLSFPNAKPIISNEYDYEDDSKSSSFLGEGHLQGELNDLSPTLVEPMSQQHVQLSSSPVLAEKTQKIFNGGKKKLKITSKFGATIRQQYQLDIPNNRILGKLQSGDIREFIKSRWLEPSPVKNDHSYVNDDEDDDGLIAVKRYKIQLLPHDISKGRIKSKGNQEKPIYGWISDRSCLKSDPYTIAEEVI